MLAQTVLAKLATAGLATKAAAAATTVVVAASAAGAADVLPGPAQETFDGLTASAEVATDEVVTDDLESGDTDFGARVSQDATGASDGAAGVDGPTIACEASQGRSQACERSAAVDAEAEDTTSPEDFGDRVSQDATGASDGVPGVDGPTIAEEAQAKGGNEGDLEEQGAEGDDDLDDDLEEEEGEEEEDDDAGRPEQPGRSGDRGRAPQG